MKKITLLFIGLLCFTAFTFADKVINVQPNGSNDIEQIKLAIEEAKTYDGEHVSIKLGGGTYHLNRNQATVLKHYISNTLSWNGSPDNLKYIGVHIKDAQNITIDGENAKLITHGEMTPVVIDNSENITLKNIIIDAADPSVTEMTVESIEGNEIIYKVHETSNYQVVGKSIKWVGEFGWSFTGGPVQLYDPVEDITWRTGNPLDNANSVTDLGDKRIKIVYSNKPGVNVGYTYQMRHGTRNQVAGFLLKSKDITYDNVKMYFMGNFGIVNQFTENINYINCHFAPEEGSGRTNAGFADFLQFSGCKGLLKIEDTYFSGAHDDPINIHGTYLKIQSYLSASKVKVKFMHHESWGFDAFFVGDSIEFINVATMQGFESAVVTEVVRNDDYNITLSFDKEIDIAAFKAKSNGVVIENITWTPEVEIRRNYFSRVPTRGVLLTTRRRSVIEDNTFYKMQMAGIYVSGDAANWYESGKVTDLSIRNNKFIECGNQNNPVIFFDPTNTQNDGYVHSNITIDNNEFYIKSGGAVGGKSVDKLDFTNNTIIHTGTGSADSYVSLNNSRNITRSNNKKVQPGTITLGDATVHASSTKAGSDKNNVIDGKNNTSWSADEGDSQNG